MVTATQTAPAALCKHGHNLALVGRTTQGGCRECARDHWRAYYARNKGAMVEKREAYRARRRHTRRRTPAGCCNGCDRDVLLAGEEFVTLHTRRWHEECLRRESAWQKLDRDARPDVYRVGLVPEIWELRQAALAEAEANELTPNG